MSRRTAVRPPITMPIRCTPPRTTEDVSREAAGLPNTCSMVGTGGQSGCFAQFQTRARLQRQQDKEDAENGGVPQD